jgi:aminoglycoside phosphotransferase family enzyme/predicted kinase
LEFLDFSTLERREAACRDELRLNSRLAPDDYLAVLPIACESSGALRLGGTGYVVDWVVQMRRLPGDRMLDRLIQEGKFATSDVERLAEFLAAFYAAATPLDVQPETYVARVEQHVRANRHGLLSTGELESAVVRRVHSSQLRLLVSRPLLFAERVSRGKLIDGHGDLRPEHICLLDPPVVFDCIEFSDELRQLDVFDELSFLAMECDRLHARWIGEAVISAYLKRSGDQAPVGLIAFYKSYRACVRAKVAAIRARQLAGKTREETLDETRGDLQLADAYLCEAGCRPILIMFVGLMGTGKSTLAAALADSLGAELLRTDVLRDQLSARSDVKAAYGEGRYRAELRTRVYAEMLKQAEQRLRAGEAVVLDGAFVQAVPREAILSMGVKQHADVAVIECVCPREVAIERIRTRAQTKADASEARPELYEQQRIDWEQGDHEITCQVDTTVELAEQLKLVFRALPNPLG